MFLREFFEEQKKSSETLETKVFIALRKAILIGYLYPGEKLLETDISNQLGVSRTPVRSAFQRLEKENLITKQSQKTSNVAKFSPIEIEQGYMLMGVLQGFAASLALENLDEKSIVEMENLHSQMTSEDLLEDYRSWLKVNNKFHDLCIRPCNNPELTNMINNNLGRLTRYWYLACSIGFLRKSIRYHAQIIEHVKSKNGDSIRKVFEEHFFETGKDIRIYLNKIMI